MPHPSTSIVKPSRSRQPNTHFSQEEERLLTEQHNDNQHDRFDPQAYYYEPATLPKTSNVSNTTQYNHPNFHSPNSFMAAVHAMDGGADTTTVEPKATVEFYDEDEHFVATPSPLPTSATAPLVAPRSPHQPSQGSPNQIVIVIRHGEREDEFTKDPMLNPSLTDKGILNVKRELAPKLIESIKQTFPHLTDEDIRTQFLVVSSPFERCVQTASALIASGVGIGYRPPFASPDSARKKKEEEEEISLIVRPVVDNTMRVLGSPIGGDVRTPPMPLIDNRLSEVFGPIRIKPSAEVLNAGAELARAFAPRATLHFAKRLSRRQEKGRQEDLSLPPLPAWGENLFEAQQRYQRTMCEISNEIADCAQQQMSSASSPSSSSASAAGLPPHIILVSHGDMLNAVINGLHPMRTLFSVEYLGFTVMERRVQLWRTRAPYSLLSPQSLKHLATEFNSKHFRLVSQNGLMWINDGDDEPPEDWEAVSRWEEKEAAQMQVQYLAVNSGGGRKITSDSLNNNDVGSSIHAQSNVQSGLSSQNSSVSTSRIAESSSVPSSARFAADVGIVAGSSVVKKRNTAADKAVSDGQQYNANNINSASIHQYEQTIIVGREAPPVVDYHSASVVQLSPCAAPPPSSSSAPPHVFSNSIVVSPFSCDDDGELEGAGEGVERRGTRYALPHFAGYCLSAAAHLVAFAVAAANTRSGGGGGSDSHSSGGGGWTACWVTGAVGSGLIVALSSRRFVPTIQRAAHNFEVFVANRLRCVPKKRGNMAESSEGGRAGLEPSRATAPFAWCLTIRLFFTTVLIVGADAGACFIASAVASPPSSLGGDAHDGGPTALLWKGLTANPTPWALLGVAWLLLAVTEGKPWTRIFAQRKKGYCPVGSAPSSPSSIGGGGSITVNVNNATPATTSNGHQYNK